MSAAPSKVQRNLFIYQVAFLSVSVALKSLRLQGSMPCPPPLHLELTVLDLEVVVQQVLSNQLKNVLYSNVFIMYPCALTVI
jgi:hypothetical protein